MKDTIDLAVDRLMKATAEWKMAERAVGAIYSRDPELIGAYRAASIENERACHAFGDAHNAYLDAKLEIAYQAARNAARRRPGRPRKAAP